MLRHSLALRHLTRPGGIAAVALLISAALAMMPEGVIAPARDVLHACLEPGLSAVDRLREKLGQAVGSAQQGARDAAEQGAMRERIVQLESQLRRQEARFAEFGSDTPRMAPAAPLLRGDLLQARVLGQQARAYLRRREILPIRRASGIQRGALVLDEDTAVLDTGDADSEKASLQRGNLVLAGRRVVGKIDRVGTRISTMVRLTAVGYRDLVQMNHPSIGPGREGPRGILVGVGKPLCRIERVDVTEPVAVGDAVYSTAAVGTAIGRPLCGTIIRVERVPGAAHWNLWMRPAARQVDRVAVLRLELGEPRFADTLHPKK